MSEKRVSINLGQILANIAWIGAILLPLSSVFIVLFWNDLAPYAVINRQNVYDLTTLGPAAKLGVLLVLLVGALIQAYGLLSVRQTFLEASAGRAYSARSLNGFRRFAWIAVVMVFIGIFQKTGLIAIFSASDPSHLGTLSIEIGTRELSALLMGLLFVFVAHVLFDGKRAKDENEAFL